MSKSQKKQGAETQPRLAFNRTVVLRYPHPPRTTRVCTRHHQPPTGRGASYSLRVSRCESLSPELAAGIRRVKGVRRLGVRVGNWLTVEQGRRLLQTPRLNALRRQELGFQFNMAMMDDLSS